MSDSPRGMKNQARFKRLKEAFETKFGPLKDGDIARIIGPPVTKHTISDWKKGKGSPVKYLERIKSILEIPIDDFWQESEPQAQEQEKLLVRTPAAFLNKEEEKIFGLLRRLPPSTKADVVAIIETLGRIHIGDLDFEDEKIYTLDDLLEMLEGMKKHAPSQAKANTIKQVIEMVKRRKAGQSKVLNSS